MDEVETFNYELSPSAILSAYQTASTLDSNGDGIPNVTQFELGINPFDPPPQDPVSMPAPIPGDITPPTVQLVEPINAINP